ncbi:hypothetical protein PV05_01340 [Exophiala xenobiotica]|uniref:Major facilitator superfamily (MFS) profile domain-containing protein n=1 Tax=Exophiala xenobiotica TaxID=348802 RepID=A0A0D2FM12_9EURO|nr:uncharacterized protein PV05_01340 [Exophiala xenobiotica]KIW61184.1 hypothetical protein PV05_01340 [Exophiala xenobiotica]
MSTIAPAFVGDAADILGRRTLYIITIGLYVASNAALAKARSFPALLGLRMLQSARTFSIAYGVIADIASPAGRGSYVSALSFGITTAPSIGPVLGGALAFTAGWRWIFWFLCIASGCCFAMMVSTLPETARNLVGNGSVAPPLGARLPFDRFMNHWNVPSHCDGRRFPNPLESLWILHYKDNLILIVGGSILYMVYCCIHASLATQFIDFYGLNQWQAGLIYLPFGAGCTLSTVFSGKLIDKGYKSIALLYGLPLDRTTRGGRELFPFEKARLRCIWIPITTATVSVSGFGWVLDKKTHISIPLVFQFIAGVSIQTCFNIYNTLLVDINHRKPAAAQASNNLVRCTLAALMVALLQPMIDHIGVGWTFTIMGAMCLISTLLFVVEYCSGMAWRGERNLLAAPERHQLESN